MNENLSSYASMDQIQKLSMSGLNDMEMWTILENVQSGERIEDWQSDAWLKASAGGEWKLISETEKYRATAGDKVGGFFSTLFSQYQAAQTPQPMDAVQYTPGVPAAGSGGSVMSKANFGIIAGIGLVTVLGIYFLTKK